MAWSFEGVTMEVCSCRSFCACNLGEADLPDGHSGVCLWDFQKGTSDGIDLSGTTAALAYEMSGDFRTRDGVGRFYIGDSADDEQRSELEAILMGRRGGVFESLIQLQLPEMLPVQTMPISIVGGDQPAATVGDVIHAVLRRYKTRSGKQTTLNTLDYLEAFGVTSEELGDSTGSRWSDPEMREWSGGAGGIAPFTIST